MVKHQRKSSALVVDIPHDVPLITTEAMSEEDFELFCIKNRDLRVEREPNGKITIMAPVHLDSGYYEGEVYGELRNFVKQWKNGRTYSPSTGFKLGVIQIVADNLKKAYLEYKSNQDEQGRIFGPGGLTLRIA